MATAGLIILKRGNWNKKDKKNINKSSCSFSYLIIFIPKVKSLALFFHNYLPDMSPSIKG